MNAAEPLPRGRLAGAAGLLALLALALYAPVGGFELLNYDDPDYVTRNPAVAAGLTRDGLAWSLGFHAANWHPLTWLSHMLDVELFGMASGPMHLENAALHALNSALLLVALAVLTRALAPSALVAALFAAHPLRVQVVAWVAERKELLASAFFLALLLAWGLYARTERRRWYWAALACLALGCAAKPMLVTAPFVLLLLDAWPLRRAPPWRARVVEKLPFLAVVAASCVLTWRAQRAGGALSGLESLSLAERLGTAGGGVLAYLRASVWPSGLAAFYPHPLLAGRSLVGPGLAGAALVALGLLAAWRARARAPAFPTGWLWFLGMLVPVIGLVQVGGQAWADRYTYLPGIGLALALVFGLRDAVRAPRARTALAVAGAAAVLALAAATRRTLPHWRDSESLFRRALAVTDANWVAHNNLGLVHLARLEPEAARGEFEAALAVNPSFDKARFNLGQAAELAGDREAAERHYRAFLATSPGNAQALERLDALARKSARAEERAAARAQLEAELARRPGDVQATAALARLDLEEGEPFRAEERLAPLLERDGGPPLAWATLALARERLGDAHGALEACERSFAAGATLPDAARIAAWILATGPGEERLDGERALELAVLAAKARAEGALEALAAAHARVGDWPSAVDVQERALAAAPEPRRAELAERLELYRARRPYTRSP